MTFSEKRNFTASYITATDVKRHRGPANSRRQKTFAYFFKGSSGERIEVCKHFFLTTLGYKKGNDRIVQDCFTSKSNREKNKISFTGSRQGKHEKTQKIDREIIKAHVESFHPAVSHYRREHAPKKRYLPSDTTITMMHQDFLEKHEIKCSYEVYRNIVTKEMNISFTRLGHEECESCEMFLLYNPAHGKNSLCESCETCSMWQIHIDKANQSRHAYEKDKELLLLETNNKNNNTAYFSSDLEKVIMIPRMEMFKQVVFCPRAIVFNQSYVPLGPQNKTSKPIAILWHEAISGRKKEDIISTYYKFFLEMRDYETIVLWVDNCSAQNKNWTPFSFLIYIINSEEISTDKIILKYFEPGHTYSLLTVSTTKWSCQ